MKILVSICIMLVFSAQAFGSCARICDAGLEKIMQISNGKMVYKCQQCSVPAGKHIMLSASTTSGKCICQLYYWTYSPAPNSCQYITWTGGDVTSCSVIGQRN